MRLKRKAKVNGTVLPQNVSSRRKPERIMHFPSPPDLHLPPWHLEHAHLYLVSKGHIKVNSQVHWRNRHHRLVLHHSRLLCQRCQRKWELPCLPHRPVYPSMAASLHHLLDSMDLFHRLLVVFKCVATC